MPDRIWLGEEETDTLDRKPEVRAKHVISIIVWRFFIVSTFLFSVAALGVILYNSLVAIDTRDAITDCIEPTGECSQRSQADLAEVIDQLLRENDLDELATRRVVVATEVCAARPKIEAIVDYNDRLTALQACVDTILAKDNQR